MADFFWSIREQKNLEESRIQRIREFLRKCMQFAEEITPASDSLLSHLSRLIVFVTEIGETEAHWLKVTAPSVGQEFFAYEFVKQLQRLLPKNPHVVADAFQAMVNGGTPSYDYKDEMKNLLLALAEHGERQAAIRMADQMRAVRGMATVFEKLSTM
jgi:hypothetical protein